MEIQDQGTSMVGEGPLLGCRHGRRGKGTLLGLFYEGANPTHEGSTLMTYSPLEGPY